MAHARRVPDPATRTPAPGTGIPAVWIHQFDALAETDLGAVSARWSGVAYVKALDGVDWMNQFDQSPLAIHDPSGSPPAWTWSTQDWVPWTVPRGLDPAAEGELTGAIAEVAGGVILDLEPYPGFWAGDEAAAAGFLAAYTAQTAAPC